MIVNDTLRTKKPSIGSGYGFYAKPSLNIKLEDGIEPYMCNTEHPQSLHIVRFNIIEVTQVQY